MRQHRAKRRKANEDADVQDATAYRILAIGEAAKGLSAETRQRHPQIPWRQILGLRNLLAHETIRTGLPALAAVCRAELDRNRE